MKKCILLWCGTMLAAAGFAQPAPLTLDEALELARQNSPALQAARMQARSADKAMGAAGRPNNPSLELEAEGLGWDNDLFSEGEYTLGLKQEFQLGGKRGKDRAVALHSKEAAAQAVEESERALTEKVQSAFIELMAQQETGKVRAEQQQLGEAFLKVAQHRRNAGGSSQLDVVRAELALEEIVLSQTCCYGDLAAAKEALASLIGIPVEKLGELRGPYYTLVVPDNLIADESLPEILRLDPMQVDETHPALLRMQALAEKTRAEALRAKAMDTPDVTLGAGVRHEAASDMNSFLFSVSMPLMFSRPGRAEYEAGALRADAVDSERAELHRALQQELAVLLASYRGAIAEVEQTKSKLMPKAKQAFELSREGYEAGRFSWLELISAQQHLADIRIRYIESLRDAHLTYAQIKKFMTEGNES